MNPLGNRATVLLVRHAHTDMAGRFCGCSDPDLSQDGRWQLQNIVQRVRQWPFKKIYSSSLLRARRTAEAIAASAGLEVNVRSGLDEINFGTWEGKSWAEIEAINPADAARWLKDYPAGVAPDGESFAGFQQRVQNELRCFAEQAQNTCAVVVTHAGFIRTTLVSVVGIAAQDGWKLPLEYGSTTVLNYSEQSWHVDEIHTL